MRVLVFKCTFYKKIMTQVNSLKQLYHKTSSISEIEFLTWRADK